MPRGLMNLDLVAGTMLVLDCKPADNELHLYGFNWSRKHWAAHAITAEERFIRSLAEKAMLTLHQTPCNGLRFCGKCNVVAANSSTTNGTDASAEAACSKMQTKSQGELSVKQLRQKEPE